MIKKGDAAPYAGVLMPEQAFRTLKYDHDFDKYLMDHEKEIAQPSLIEECDSSKTFLFSVLFFALGLGVGVIIR